MLAYGITRFVIEFVRGDAGRGLYFQEAVSLSQIISIVLVPLSLGMLAWLARRPEATPGAGQRTLKRVS